MSETQFPSLDKSVITVGSVYDESDEKEYWLSQSPTKRLEALEINRQIAYGYDPISTRLQRILETDKLA